MERKQVRFTRQQAVAVRRAAARRKTSNAAIIREAVDQWLRLHGHGDADDRWQRALGVVGAFASGRRDVSREHDREVAEAFRS